MKEHDQPAAKPRTLKRRSSVRDALQLPTESDYSTWKIGAKETMAFSLLSMNVVDRADLPGEVVNKRMNRHLDILPNPRTRVILPAPVGKESDPRHSYINANYIRGSDPRYKKNFIAAMGPLKETVIPFWKMIWIDDVHEVVMVTGLVEKGQSKCARYWPVCLKPGRNLPRICSGTLMGWFVPVVCPGVPPLRTFDGRTKRPILDLSMR